MKLIDKDALVAEIERRLKKARDNANTAKSNNNHSVTCVWSGHEKECHELISFINTLEVKEVDLEKVIEEYFKGWTDDYDNEGAACHYQYVQVNDCKAIAKHFFELGLKAQKDLTI